MDTTPVLIVTVRQVIGTDSLIDAPFVDRVADKVRTLAAVKPALVRLLEWQIDQELERTSPVRPTARGAL